MLPLHANCRCIYLPVIDLEKKIDANKTNKEYNKNIEVPIDTKIMNGMDQKTKDTIVRTINETVSKYNVTLDEVKVISLGANNENVPFQYQPLNQGGFLVNRIAINKDYYFNGSYEDFTARIQRNYNRGVLAAQSIEDLMNHELAHVMTFQECDRYTEFKIIEDEVRGKFVSGVSDYADSTYDGAETIAEAFVKIKNGEYVSEKVKKLVQEYVERWRK